MEVRVEIPTPPKKEVVKKVEKEAPYVVPSLDKPKIHFSLRIIKAKLGAQFAKFMDMIKKLYVTEILAQMPNYVKFLKEILSKKRKLEEHETITSAVIQNMPLKQKDLEVFQSHSN